MEQNNTQNTPSNPENNLETNQQTISGIWDNISAFMHNLLDIRKDSDSDETIESVRGDISFQGHNAWILIFSVFVASVGLNANSPAVVIGAMLISPLMGPIVGMGLGTAINDDKMLRRSLTNLIVMVVLSLLTASLYFFISPIKEMGTELEARTFPTILDVLIAIFGGLALIVAKAKKGTISNAIAGVAIATALMPPLCTAGYGIAIWSLKVFSGAMYLFCINTVFIALATYVVCKLLRFPMVKYANQAKRKRVSRWATLIGLVVLAPSIYLFWQLYQDQVKKNAAEEYFKEVVNLDGMRPTREWNKETRSLDIQMWGKPVPQPTIDDWKSKFYKIEDLEDCTVEFYQGTSITENNEDFELVQGELIDQLKQIQNKEVRIAELEKELTRLSNENKELDAVSEEIRVNYPELSNVSFAKSINVDFNSRKKDTTLVYNVIFKDSTLSTENRTSTKTRMAEWLGYRLKSNKIKVIEVNRAISVSNDSTTVISD